MDVVTGDVWIADGRIAGVGRAPDELARGDDDRRRRRPGASGLRADARPSVPDALSRARGRLAAARLAQDARLAARSGARRTHAARGRATGRRRAAARRHDHRADDGDGSRHGRRVRRARADRTARHRRQVPDERPRRRAGAPLAVARATRSTRTLALHRPWHGSANGRLRSALAPRFAISCSRDLLEATAALSNERGLLVHTHASEQREEIDVVRAQTGLDNVAYLCVRRPRHRAAVRRALRLGDRRGTTSARRAAREGAPLPRVQSQARIGHRARSRKCARAGSRSRWAPTARRATTPSTCFTRCGSRRRCRRCGTARARCRRATSCGWPRATGPHALGLDREIGSIEAGKRADLIVVATGDVRQVPGTDPYSTLVYACGPTDVRATMVDGACRRGVGATRLGGSAGDRGHGDVGEPARCSPERGCGDSGYTSES